MCHPLLPNISYIISKICSTDPKTSYSIHRITYYNNPQADIIVIAMQYLPPTTSYCKRILIHRRRRRRQKRCNNRQVIGQDCNVVKRRRSRHSMMYMNDDGVWERLKPRKTFWCMFYLNSPQIGNTYYENKFRDRFRLPYKSFKELLDEVKIHPLFKRWMHKRVDTNVVLGFLLLGTLRYLGRGWTFDELGEATSMSMYVHRDFFHIFVKFGQEYLYTKHVKYPTKSNEMEAHTR